VTAADTVDHSAHTPKVSVVVPTRDRADRLTALLESLARQNVPPEQFEVIVVDDGSRDHTPDVLKRIAADSPLTLCVIEGPGAGPAAARNAGWPRASAPLIAFTDDDCEPDPGWLAAGIEAAAAAPGAFVQGRTRPAPDEASRRGPLLRTKWIEGLGPWYQTCNIFYPRGLLERLGGFDEGFTRPFGEDVDLAWRALESGAAARFEPRALVNHAVESLGPVELLKSALRDPDEAMIFKRHLRLRRDVRRLGLFKSDHHALLVLAALGLVIGRGRGAWVALAIPYLILILARCRAGHAHPGWAPWLIAHDAIELTQAARGAVRHRVPLL
jgi:glycosyltransferase involved in cell wall biosynthesis